MYCQENFIRDKIKVVSKRLIELLKMLFTSSFNVVLTSNKKH